MGRPHLGSSLIPANQASLATKTDAGLLLLRAGAGAVLIGLHGWPRFVHAYSLVFHGEPWTFVARVEALGFPLPAVFAVASALAESVGALLLILGLFSPVAAAVIAGDFVVATASEIAGGDVFGYPALYLLIALVVLIIGPGRFSLDALWRRRRRAKRPDPRMP